MKKFLKLCAAFSLIGALFVGCIDNSEPDGVRALREAKARLIDSKREVEAAKAVYILSKSKYVDSQTEINKQKAEILKQKAESMKIANDYEKRILDDKVAAEIARLQVQQEKALTALYEQQSKTAKAELAYLKQLVSSQKDLADHKIHVLDAIITNLQALIVEKAALENEILMWQALYQFYDKVELPLAERQLSFALEMAQLEYTHAKYYFDTMTAVKNLALSEYVDFANELHPKITELYEKEVLIESEIAKKMAEKADLEVIRDKAENDYYYSGVGTELATVNFPDVFSSIATDIFSVTRVDIGDNPGGSDYRRILSGVYNNTYSFYWPVGDRAHNVPEGTLAHLGYYNTLNVLKADYNQIKNGRIYGLEGKYFADKELKNRLDLFEDALGDYEDACETWRDSYQYIKTSANWTWAAQLTAFNNAKTAYEQTYGFGFDAYNKAYKELFLEPGLAGRLAALQNEIPGDPLSLITWLYKNAENQIAYLVAITLDPSLDPNVRTQALSLLPVNCLYAVQKTIIEEYIKIFKGLISGDYGDYDWSKTIVNLSDILGGISFTPSALARLIFGDKNFELFNSVISALMGIARNIDMVDMLNKIMPAYYAKTAAYLGSSIYDQGPIMQKYGVTGNWEYHAWFLIYILFEKNPVSIGNNIFRINSYDNVYEKLPDDFLGLHAANYPGWWYYKTVKASNVAVVLADRVDPFNTVLKFGKATATTYPDNAALNGLITAEDNLRKKWHAFGTNLADLNESEEDLFTPYNRTWQVDGYPLKATTAWKATTWPYPAQASGTTPVWVSSSVSGAVGDVKNFKFIPNTTKPDFYFMPELALDRDYPSIVDGEDIYWANLAYPGSYTDDNVYVNWLHLNFYPALAARRGSLVSVNWNEWLNVGRPFYNNDPILWANTFHSSTVDTWENNIGAPDALVPLVFVTRRNYEQYKFWYEQNQAYIELAAEMLVQIDALQAKVDALYQVWVDAQTAITLKEYEIYALRTELNLYVNSAGYLEAVYEYLYKGLNDGPDSWMAQYTAAFNWFTNAEYMYNWAKTNYDNFTKNQTYYSTAGFWPTFTADQRINITAEIDRVNERIAIIDKEMADLESAKDEILKVVIK